MRPLILLGLLFAVMLCSGCSKPVVGKADRTYERLFRMGAGYMKATDALNRAPANLAEIKPYLGEDDIGDIFRSDNDQEEFVILWGVDYRTYQNDRKPLPVMAYEKTGKRGLRYIVQGRTVSQVTTEQLQQVAFPPGQKPPT